MEQCYINKSFKAETVRLIDIANGIIEEYQQQGFVLTVRQLYYQLVARDVIPNTLQEYKRVASIINDAKLAGLIDWDAIEDRTRQFVRLPNWNNGAEILESAVRSFHKDMWARQADRVFVIVEKEALVGVLQGVCNEFDVPLLAARGYPSGTVLREFAVNDLLPAFANGQGAIVLHFGDHDPSGIDMTRDIKERLSLFCDDSVDVRRIALTMDQIEEQRPPENPAKVTDSRFAAYMRNYGGSSWELDALSPAYLADLVRENVEPFIMRREWEEVEQSVADTKEKIRELARGLVD